MKDDEDEFDAFGRMIAEKTRKLSEQSRRSFLEFQMKVNTLLNQTEIEFIDN